MEAPDTPQSSDFDNFFENEESNNSFIHSNISDNSPLTTEYSSPSDQNINRSDVQTPSIDFDPNMFFAPSPQQPTNESQESENKRPRAETNSNFQFDYESFGKKFSLRRAAQVLEELVSLDPNRFKWVNTSNQTSNSNSQFSLLEVKEYPGAQLRTIFKFLEEFGFRKTTNNLLFHPTINEDSTSDDILDRIIHYDLITYLVGGKGQPLEIEQKLLRQFNTWSQMRIFFRDFVFGLKRSNPVKEAEKIMENFQIQKKEVPFLGYLSNMDSVTYSFSNHVRFTQEPVQDIEQPQFTFQMGNFFHLFGAKKFICYLDRNTMKWAIYSRSRPQLTGRKTLVSLLQTIQGKYLHELGDTDSERTDSSPSTSSKYDNLNLSQLESKEKKLQKKLQIIQELIAKKRQENS